MSLLLQLVEYVASDKQLRKAHGAKVVSFLYEHWHLFREFWIEPNLESKLLLVALLTKCCCVELVPFEATKAIASSLNISEMYMSLLVDASTTLSFKCKLLDMLCVFGESPAPYQLKTYLNRFVTEQLPLRSAELRKGDDDYQDYLSVVRKMLVAVEMSSTPPLDLVALVVGLFCREEKHLCDEEIQTSLIGFVRRLDDAKQTHVTFI